jgi:protein phosphatase
MRIDVYGHTEKGPRHEVNEDVILVGHTVCTSKNAQAQAHGDDGGAFENGLLVAVADGMGRDAVGGAAANLMLKTLEASFYREARGHDLRALANMLYNIAQDVNEVVLEFGEQQSEYAGMACTLSGVLLLRDEYVAFNAGDSRVYRYSHGVLRQLTEDHSVVAMAVRTGEMTLIEAQASSERHYVTNAMGSDAFQLQLGECQSLQAVDALLVCSDGLHNVMGLGRMEGLLARHDSAEARCRALVEAAIESGDFDDVSVIIVNVEEAESSVGAHQG